MKKSLLLLVAAVAVLALALACDKGAEAPAPAKAPEATKKAPAPAPAPAVDEATPAADEAAPEADEATPAADEAAPEADEAPASDTKDAPQEAPALEGKVGGGDIVYDKAAMGVVTFSHDFHVTKQGKKCTDCHTDPFAMKIGAAKISMADIYAGKLCGKCHGGKGPGFEAKTNCMRCHKKP